MVKNDSLRLTPSSNIGKKVQISKDFDEKIAFNFSYLSKNKNYYLESGDKKWKIKLYERLNYLSSMDKTAALSLDKTKGFELISEDQCKCNIPTDFINSGRNDACGDQFSVFRNGRDCRVLGKFNKNIFYILFIDKKLKAYKH